MDQQACVFTVDKLPQRKSGASQTGLNFEDLHLIQLPQLAVRTNSIKTS